jgi:argininosuccinate lyase
LKPPETPYLVLVDHSPSALHVLESIRQMGLRIFYLGKDRQLQDQSDLHRDIQVTTELDQLLQESGEELKKLPIAGVFTFLEHAKFAERKLADYLGKLAIPEQTLLYGRDKLKMREAIRDAGLPCPEFHFIADSEQAPLAPMSFPFIIKPNLGYASGGVQLVHSQESFQAALHTIRRMNHFVLKTGFAGAVGAICEQFIAGPEFSVDSITVGGWTRSFCICGREFPGDQNFQDYVYFSPPEHEAAIRPELETQISKLLREIGYSDGPSHTEIRYHQESRTWYILETALRVGFAGNIGRLHEEITGIPYNMLALRAALHQLSAEELLAQAPCRSAHGILFTPATGKGGTISSIGGIDLLRQDSRIKYFHLQKDVGQNVIAYPKGLEYLGVVIGVTPTREAREALAAELCQKVVFHYE